MSTAPESEVTSASATPAAVNENAAAELFAQANLYLAKQTKPVIIPSFAKWFNLNEIHEIEKKSLPEFFSSQSNQKYKNPDIYKSVRDFIVNTYRLNPIEYLSLTAIRRNVAMDVGSLMRIYSFLSKWGIINYQIDPKTKSFAIGPQFTGHFQITLDKPSGFQLQAFENEVSKKTEKTEVEAEDEKLSENAASNDINKMDVDEPDFKRQKISNSITPNTKLNLQLRRNVYDSVDDALLLQDSNANSSKQVKRMYCSITGNDITETKYHNLKNKSNISSECYQNSQFEDYFKNTDFVKIDKINLNNDSTPWSNNEILLLLEGIEMFGDDWNLISGHVGSRPKDQCIIKFIQLPVEDTFLFKQISKSSYVEYLKKLKSDKTIDFSSLLSKACGNGIQIQHETTTKTTTTITGSANATENITEHAKKELNCQDKIITSILKLALRKFELKLQSFINLESVTSEEKKVIEFERENLNLDKLKVKKQCSKVRQQLLKASDVVQSVKADSEITPEGIESAISEAVALIDRAISEAKYDPNAESSLVTKKAEIESDDVADNQTPATEDDFEPISVVEPKLFSVWSA
ncbi:hypothetical protein CANINC_003277 [Pichia inconspicua]|uniref:SWIRM domain-containing protein n=1 Tax=Pichia inconspicua TaxID=52247 RepID=A0A4T0X0F4_9ASCO|nr:hypothetical protein CANINC_003277 [[Candida] inconspicua]